MAGAFQLINSKDLVWSKLVHEYLMGAHTPMTALRAWNADATRLPARMHSEYLRQLYLHNDLAEGRYHAGGQLVRLADIELPLLSWRPSATMSRPGSRCTRFTDWPPARSASC